jgi:tetratricopeptide (TPR) repeat protein
VSFRSAIGIDPRADGAYTNLGVALHGLKQYQEAIAAYEQAVDLKSRLPETYYGLGLAYKAVGDTKAASQQLTRLRQLDAEMAKALANQLK